MKRQSWSDDLFTEKDNKTRSLTRVGVALVIIFYLIVMLVKVIMAPESFSLESAGIGIGATLAGCAAFMLSNRGNEASDITKTSE